MQQEYKITWTIEVTGESPKEAAKQALALFKANGSTVTVFRAEDRQGIITEIDLDLQTKQVVESSPVYLGVVLEGGMVQAIVSNQPEQLPPCRVIDYDTHGMAADEITEVIQNDGSTSKAMVYDLWPHIPSIDLKGLYSK